MNIFADTGYLIYMKSRPFSTILVVLIAVLSATGWALDDTIGPATVPPTSFSSGLVQSPNPIDTSANLVMTGNIAGGAHFRGVVPYGSTSGFMAPADLLPHTSSSLDSFLRRSAGSGNLGRYSGKLTPFYSPSGTVTTTRPGRYDVIGPPVMTLGGSDAGSFAAPQPALPKGLPLSAYKDALSYGQLPDSQMQQAITWTPQALHRIATRPMSLTMQQMENIILPEADYPQSAEQTAQWQRTQIEQPQPDQLRRDLLPMDERIAELQRKLTGIQEPAGDVSKPFETQTTQQRPDREDLALYPQDLTGRPPSQMPSIELITTDKQIDVYEQMKRQIDNLRISLELPAAPQPEESGKVQEQLGAKTSQGQSVLSEFDGLSAAELSARAKGILGTHKTFASYSNDKFNQCLRAGEDYLKKGRYYRAADAYTLALVYKPNDPLAYAGKSHALFAAGEYVSSALFLSRALEIFPEYAQFEIDIVSMVGDRDKLETRIVDVELWLEQTNAPELNFLLGYVYYHMGRVDRAKEQINSAYRKMPESPAVITLKKVIDARIESWQLPISD